jgi:hypothetical protein
MKLCRGTQNFAYRGEPWGVETAGEAEFGVRLPDGIGISRGKAALSDNFQQKRCFKLVQKPAQSRHLRQAASRPHLLYLSCAQRLEYILGHTNRTSLLDLYAVRTPPACFEQYELQHV